MTIMHYRNMLVNPSENIQDGGVDTERLAEFVRARRLALGLTQQEVADRSGGRLKQSDVSKIETGGKKYPEAVKRRGLADALGVSHLDLLVAAGELTPPEAGMETGSAERLGQTVKALREERGWTQTELADLIGPPMKQGDVSNLECGKVELPRRPRLERLAAIFGVPLGELLARSGWNDADRYVADATDDGADPEVEAVCAALRRGWPNMDDRARRFMKQGIGVYDHAPTPAPQPVGVKTP